ncbi:MAG: RNA-binding S4 domain-containing protein [Prevotellaceae bacterium]|jgi:ribosome-associated heat shock protein Hsp15|nr:RNA-binding S4 domain-containing protein [Prevotellaceae bacterium]
MELRIDKWLWAMRLFKTRTLAAEACKKGRIFIKGVAVKPSRMIKVGDVIDVRRNVAIYSFEVLQLTPNRLNAVLVADFMRDVTTGEQLERIEAGRIAASTGRARGAGRPTKKERRDLDDFFDPVFHTDEFEE